MQSRRVAPPAGGGFREREERHAFAADFGLGAFACVVDGVQVVASGDDFLDRFRDWGKEHHAGENLGLREGLEGELRCDAEVLACSKEAPEEVWVGGLTGFDDGAIGEDDGRADGVVDDEAVGACEVAVAAAEGEASDAGV